MLTSRLKRLTIGLVFLTGLAACETGPGTLGFLDGSVPGRSGPPEIREAVLAGSVNVTAPLGYCVDTRSKRNGLTGGFVVLAPCAALKIPGIEWPETVAVMTVSATRGDLPAASAADLEALVTSPDGRILLATSSGDAVEVLQTASGPGAFFVRVRESEAPVTALEPTYWRGLIAAGGRLVSLTVRGYDAEPLGAEQGLRMIRSLAADIRAGSQIASAETPAVADPAPEVSRAGLFRRQE